MDSSKIGNFIKEKLKEKGLKQEKLAEMLGISSSAVSQALSGKNSFDIENLTIISDIIDESIDRILHGGKERETRLEKLSKLTVSDFLKREPDLKCLHETDDKDKTIFEYVVDHTNDDLITFFEEKGYAHKMNNDLRYLTYLISKNKESVLESLNVFDINYHEMIKKDFCNLNKNEISFLKTLFECSNERIQNSFKLYSENADMQVPKTVHLAISLDTPNVVNKYLHSKISVGHDLRKLSGNRLQLLLKESIKKKSRKSFSCIYEYMKNDSECGTPSGYVKEILATKDAQFIKWMQETYPSMLENLYSVKMNNTEIQSLISHISEDNDSDLLEVVKPHLNQEELDIALANCKVGDINLIKALINAGARVSTKDTYGGGIVINEPLTAIVKEILLKR